MESRREFTLPSNNAPILNSGAIKETVEVPLEAEDETEIDIEVPVLTDDDIETIAKDMYEKGDIKPGDIKPESLGISKSMSAAKDISLCETENSRPDEHDTKIDEQSAIANAEIDTIQKHVEESLLFLDHKQETDNDSEKKYRNVEDTDKLEPVKEIDGTDKLKPAIEVDKNEDDTDKLEPVKDIDENVDDTDKMKPVKDIIWETFESVEKAEKITDSENNVKKSSEINPTLDAPKMTDIPEENDANVIENNDNAKSVIQNENTTELIQKMKEDEPHVSSQESINDHDLPIEQAQEETDVSNEHSEISTIKTNKQDPEIINNNDDAMLTQEHESLSDEQRQTFEEIDENLTNEGTLLCQAQNETNGVLDKMDDIVDSNAQLDLHNISQEVARPTLNQTKEEINNISDNIDEPTVSQKVEEVIHEISISSENPEQIAGHSKTMNKTPEQLNVTDIVQKDEIKHERTIEDVENSQILQESSENSKLTKNENETEVHSIKIENVTGIGQIKQEFFRETPVLTDNTQTEVKVEKMNEDQDSINLEIGVPPQIKQENVDDTIQSDNTKEINESANKKESIDTNNLEPQIAKKQDNLEETTVTHEEEMNSEVIKNIHIEPPITAKPQNIRTSPIEQANETNVSAEKLISDSNCAQNVALKTIPIINQSEKTPEKQYKVSCNKNNEHSGSLKVWYSQKSSDISIPQNAQKPETNEKISFNPKSVHSASLKVTLQDNDECPPAKKARVEPVWSTASENTDSAQTNTTNEPVKHTWSLKNTTNEDNMVWSTAASDVTNMSAYCETAQEPASNRSQSSCSSIVEDIPMDVDSDDKDSQPIQGSLEQKVYNKDVLILRNLPLSFKGSNVYQLVRKYTKDANTEIGERIVGMYIDKSSGYFSTAFVKWPSEKESLVIQAEQLLSNSGLTFEGRKFVVRIDYKRRKVDWDENEKPIVKPKTKERTKTIISQSTIAPFTSGEVDYRDKPLYGLNLDFLTSLNITPPLTCNVIVNNLDKDMDELKLRNIFSIAGNIHSLTFMPKKNSHKVRISYDHPLEAVQAISIFDKQDLYGRVIQLTMDKTIIPKPLWPVLPGFTKLGLGLGKGGTILRNVRVNTELEILRSSLNKEIYRYRQMINSAKFKLNEALKVTKNNALQQKALAERSQTKPFQEDTANSAPQQNPENVMGSLANVIASSIQSNLLNMMSFQTNPQGFMPQNQNSVTWTNAEAPNWTQPNHLSTMQMPDQSYPGSTNIQPTHHMQMHQELQPLVNMQITPNMQTGPIMQTIPSIQMVPNMQTPNIQMAPNMQTPNIQMAPNMQTTPNTKMASKIQTTPVIQPSSETIQYGLAANTDPKKLKETQTLGSNKQTGFSNPSNPNIFPPLPPSNLSQPKVTSRFDIPPVVPKIRNRGAIITGPMPGVKPVPPAEAEYKLDIPLPVAKPQNRGPTALTAKTVPPVKPTKPVGIIFNIPSLSSKASTYGELDLIPPPVPKPQKRNQAPASTSKQPAYTKMPSPKKKSPVKEMPWINKQIKAMRRNSKSPERPRTRSPKYDKGKELTREKDYYSRDRENVLERQKEEKKDSRRKELTSVVFKQLPYTVSTDDLRDKMREIGKVLTAQVNRNGSAFVVFKYQRDAETCIEMYNRSKVDGQTIEVKWAK